MIVRNGMVFTKDCVFCNADVIIGNDIIEEVRPICADIPNDDYVIDATGLYVIPGLTDIHFHGCAGHDFCEGSSEGLQAIADYELKEGITSIMPASMTLSEEKLAHIFQTAAQHDNRKGATIVGIHMEGPFISYEKRGAQNGRYIRKPDADLFFRLQEKANGLIRLVDVAPEVEGALQCIDQIAKNVHVSIAHTTADYKQTMRAFARGADHVTHLYNGMPPFHHRNPGVVGAAADYEEAYVELIADGVHCDPAVVRATLRMFGSNRVVFISDSLEACGMPDGEYQLGGQAVTVREKRAVLHDGTIAGSVLNLMDCLRICVKEMKIPLADVVKCAAVNPAKSVGIYDKYGSLEKGKIANMVLLDQQLTVKYVIHNGKIKK